MRTRVYGIFAAAIFAIVAGRALATPSLVMDVATGNVLYEDEANRPWFPASLTKLMTVYVALSAVRDHQISLDTPLVVSRYAASMPPSKMGFNPGTEVTLGNALKMLMVKSPNDIAIVIAEGIAGSVPAFADDMNAAAAQLGMRQSHFVNPNGLHNPAHYSSARDLAVLARAIYMTFPQYAALFDIGAMRVDGKIIPNHNDMLGRYPGADGMKTGFTCNAGFNLVASATRGNHHYIAVVLGAPTVRTRLIRTAVLLDRAFDGIDHPQPMDADEPTGGEPADMHDEACRRRNRAAAVFQSETDRLEAPLLTIGQRAPTPFGVFSSNALADETPAALRIAMMPEPVFDPEPVSVGPEPGYSGPIAGPRPAHSPVGTPLLANVPTPIATPAATNEPNEDTPEAADDHPATKKVAAKVASEDTDDADTPAKTKKHGKTATRHVHHDVAEKPAHGKHKLAKADKKSKLALHKSKSKSTKLAKSKTNKVAAKKLKSKNSKLATKKIKSKKLASKSRPKHSASSDN
jgi:D-alanyl-D-alanine carboxypeptidase